jgi:hypothetical protein
MSHFYGVLSGSRGQATRCGTPKSGIVARVMGWGGAVRVEVYHHKESGEDRFTVSQCQHPSTGAGIVELIAEGVIGKPYKRTEAEAVNREMLDALKNAALEIGRIINNQAEMNEEDLTDIARPDESLLREIEAIIKKAEG